MVTIAWNPLEFHLLAALPKGNTCNAESYRVNIFTELLPLRQLVDGRGLIIHADNTRPHTRENAELFANKIGLASTWTHCTQLISYHPISFSSDILNIVCRELLFQHVKNYLRQFIKSSEPSGDQPWRTRFGTGWRDSFLRTLATIIHRQNTG
jgi:hypothetical protein